jgi:hypothetical protein
MMCAACAGAVNAIAAIAANASDLMQSSFLGLFLAQIIFGTDYFRRSIRNDHGKGPFRADFVN